MISHGYNPELGVLVGVFTGPTNSDRDYAEWLDQIARLDRDGVTRAEPLVTLLVVAPENPQPDAMWRKRIAEHWSKLTAPRHVLALVTSSPVIRGVLTVVNWFTPSDARRLTAPHATVDDALRFIERHRPGVGAELARLYARATELAPRAASGRM